MSNTKIIHLIRHAEAEHNVDLDYDILDAPLTELGREQAARLNGLTVQGVQQNASLLISSPLSRTLQTSILGFPALRARLEAEGKPGIIVLSRLQEVNDYPCDTGRSRQELEATEEFAGIDFSSLEDDWNGKKGDFDPANVKVRAKWVRQWLRARPENTIVVVAHGDILRRIAKLPIEQSWSNAEVREFTFASNSSDDQANLIAVKKVIQTGEDAPTSSSV